MLYKKRLLLILAVIVGLFIITAIATGIIMIGRLVIVLLVLSVIYAFFFSKKRPQPDKDINV